MENLKEKIFTLSCDAEFEEIALQIFRYQYKNIKPYGDFCKLMKKNPENTAVLTDIPFLPIQFFKSHTIFNDTYNIEETFLSSGTTGMQTSQHFITDISVYEESYRRGFLQFYGNIEDYCILALLPSYLEREGSSLIYMTRDLIEKSNNPQSGFYLHNYAELIEKLERLDHAGQKVLLLGVTYSLLDLIEQHQFRLKNTIIMETGGMKGRRKELIREELHQILCKGFGVSAIHSEYGMTELLSQAYSLGNGIFRCVPSMKILIRDTEDALHYLENGKTGGINVIDLANYNSCSFIATQDLGKKYPDDTFEVLGRFDNSDIRGCNLLI